MDIQAKKLALIEWISRVEDTSVIEELQSIQENYAKTIDWHTTLNKEELESIKRGLKDIEEGNLNSHEAAKKIYGKYL